MNLATHDFSPIFKAVFNRLRLGTVAVFVAVVLLAGQSVRADRVITNLTSAALEEALGSAPGSDDINEITFAASGTITLSKQFVIRQNTQLNASSNTVTIQGGTGSNDTTRFFNVRTGITLHVMGVTFSNGRSTNGGAIYNRGILIASNCTFRGNVAAGKDGVNGANGAGDDENGKNGSDGATGKGGAIFNTGKATLERCTFENNRATGGNGGNGGNGTNAPPGGFEGGDGGRGGDGGSAQGGAVYSSGRNLIVTDCTFEDNRVAAGNAGSGGTAGTGGVAGVEKGGGTGGSASGAAIFTIRRAAIQNSTFVGNTAQGGDSATAGTDEDGDGVNGPSGGVAQGGAIANVGTNGIINCTFFRNTVTGGNAGAGGDGDLEGGDGGNGGNGIGGSVYNAGRIGVTNCTFFGGGAFGGLGATNGLGFIPGDPGRNGDGLGGNIATVAGRFLMVNSILSAHIGGGNGYGTGTDLGYNISSDNSLILPGPGSRTGIDPRLDPPLANNGGPTRTLALRPNSPAVDNGHPVICPETDQRGFPRSGACDIGAFEFVIGVVEGRVLDNNGSPLDEVMLFLEGDSTTADSEGFYSFTGLSAGDYDLHATAPGFRFEPAFTNVTIGASGTAITVDFTAFPLPAVSGAVTVNGSNGLANVRIISGSLSTTTLSNGTYELVGVASNATVNIRPELDGYYFLPASTNVNVASNGVVNFAAIPLLGISGIIDANGVGLNNVRVSAGNVSTLTSSTGYYRLTGFPTNVPVTVRPELSGHSFRPPSTNVLVTSETTINFTADATVVLGGRITSDNVGVRGVSVMVGGATVVTDPDGIYVASNVARNVEIVVRPQAPGYSFSPPFTTLTPTADTNVNFIATGNFTLSGRVTLDGQPGAGVAVMAGGRSANTDSSGNYIFTQLAPAVYTVRPSATNYAFSPASRIVNVSTNVTGIDFAGFTAYDIFGSVIDGDTSLGLGGVGINATNSTAPTNRFVVSVGDGTFALTNLMPGNFTLTPTRSGYEFTPTNMSFPLADSTNLPPFIGFQVFSISGSITNGTNRITNVLVSAGSYTNRSDSNGVYRFPSVRRGTYDIVPTLQGYTFEPPQVRVTVQNANISDLGFRANGIYALRGRIIKDGAPLVGAEVVAGSQRVLTGSDGRYEFTQVPPGTYIVRPTPGQHAFDPPEIQVTVVDQNRENLDFTASLAFSVSGRVTSGGSGIAGVVVTVAGRSNVTDLAGGYTIAHVPAGNHTVVPTLDGSEFDPPNRPVSVTTHLAGVDFRRVFSIRGQVLEGNQPIPGANVTLSNQTAFVSVATDAEGFYHFRLLDAGTYTVRPMISGKAFLPSSAVITVGPSTNGIDFRTVYTISGRVVKGSSGLRQVIVSLSIDPETNLVETATDVNGFYAFTNIQGGEYTLTPSLFGNGFVPPSTNFVISSNMVINFEAYTLFNISGRIVTPGGIGLAGVTVSTGDRSTVSDGLGNYSITSLASNIYTVAASLPCFTFAPATRSVTLGPNAVSINFTGTFQSFTVRGMVTDGANPLRGVFIKVEDATAVSGTNKTTFSDSNGVFVVSNVCPGDISVSASHSGFYFEPRQYETNLTSNIDVNFVGSRGLSISGRVLDAAGNGIFGVRIRSDSGDAVTDAEGTYVIQDLGPGLYTLRPVQVGSGISPTNQPVTVGSSDVFGVNFQINPPRISITRTNSEVELSLLGFPNQPYTIEFSTNFVDWRFLYSTNAPATNMPGVFTLRDSAATNSPARFYRAVNF